MDEAAFTSRRRLRDAIIGDADEVRIGADRQIRLLNPSRSLGLVEASK